MILYEHDLQKNSKINVNEDFFISKELIILYNNNIKKVYLFHLTADFIYNSKKRTLKVNGFIYTKLQIEDSRTLNLFDKEYEIPWNAQYFFQNSGNINENYLIEEKFDIISYAWDEVIVNIPVNLTHSNDKIISDNSSWQVLSEQEVNNVPNNKSQFDWEELDHTYQQKEGK